MTFIIYNYTCRGFYLKVTIRSQSNCQNRRFTDLWFNRVVYIILFLTGVQLVLGRNLLSLMTG